jgi:hypothetical protein
MKKSLNYLSIIFFISCSSYLFSQEIKIEDWYQKFFLLENISKNYKIQEYTLNTNELYEVNRKLSLFNINMNNGILLITVLPDLKGNEDWIKIDINKIKDRIITDNGIKNFISEQFSNNSPKSKTMKYGLIKRINNEYYVSNYCLVEYFNIREYEYPQIVKYGTINTRENPVTIKDMDDIYKKKYPKDKFPLDVRPPINRFMDDVIERNYLSKEYKVKNDLAYQFWTYDRWDTTDYYNTRRGIDRFIYIPQKGIIGGSYDFYFEYNNGKGPIISYKKLWDNIINEKVMIAEELK